MLPTVFALPSLHTPPTVVSHAAHQPPEPTSSSSSSPRSLVRPPDERLTALAAAHRDLLAILGTDEAAIRARVAERRHTSSAARHPRSGRSLSARFFSKTVPNHLPIRAHFPKVQLSNFAHGHRSDASLPLPPQSCGWWPYDFANMDEPPVGTGAHVGTASSRGVSRHSDLYET